MIAELADNSFELSVFSRKLDYNQKKIDKGVGELLYSSLACEDLKSFKEISELVVNKNDRVQLPYHEVSISLPDGDRLSNDDFIKLGNDYMEMFGAGEHSYAIIRHTDKPHEHIHILFTTVDIEGKWLNNYNERIRSFRISRELEKRYNLSITESKQKTDFSLSEIKAREFYFHNALVKGLKSYSTRESINNLLEKVKCSPHNIHKNLRSNIEYELLFGDTIYKEIGSILDKNNYFSSLYKDELLIILDKIYDSSNSIKEFRSKLEKENIYMRFLTDKGKSKFVYGLPDIPIYFNDRSLPEKYRCGHLNFPILSGNNQEEFNLDITKVNTEINIISKDEQKHIIYNLAFLALKNSLDYTGFKQLLQVSGVDLAEYENSRGVYGLSFKMLQLEDAEVFKASDISRHLSYNSINQYYNRNNEITVQESNNVPIFAIVNNGNVINEMQQSLDEIAPRYINSHNMSYFEDDTSLISRRKRKKGRGKGYSL